MTLSVMINTIDLFTVCIHTHCGLQWLQLVTRGCRSREHVLPEPCSGCSCRRGPGCRQPLALGQTLGHLPTLAEWTAPTCTGSLHNSQNLHTRRGRVGMRKSGQLLVIVCGHRHCLQLGGNDKRAIKCTWHGYAPFQHDCTVNRWTSLSYYCTNHITKLENLWNVLTPDVEMSH